ncbi:hypothetical protein [Bacillus velezensis]|uniref:hypothetical protein n=1 Tax=Bacillus velezensis TaxID=492670 RepID=UPI0013D640C3|nr:hypothetical protein [Bacillus velezensis]
MDIKCTMSSDEIWVAIWEYMIRRGYSIKSGRFKGGVIEPFRAELELKSKG